MTQKWISIKDELPKEGTLVLVINGKLSCISLALKNNENKIIFILIDTKELFYENDKESVLVLKNITHWMNLPDLPKDDK